MFNTIAHNLNLPIKAVENALNLFNDGATIPFVARYRKELIENLNEIDLRNIIDEKTKLEKLEKRKSEILNSLAEQNINNKQLIENIKNAQTMPLLEDLYLPYKKSKKTKADIAIEQGFGKIADIIKTSKFDKNKVIEDFAKVKKLESKQVIEQAIYILAQEVSHSAEVRQLLRNFIFEKGFWECTKKDIELDAKQKYKDFYDYKIKIAYLKPHRILAILRAEKEKIISLKLDVNYIPTGKIRYLLKYHKSLFYSDILEKAVNYSFKKLIKPSLHTEICKTLFKNAEQQAVNVFASNLRSLLLSPPLPAKVTLGIDPGFKTGCKCAIVNKNLDVLSVFNIYPHTKNKNQQASILIDECQKHKVELIAIGNGSYSFETAEFVGEFLIKSMPELKYTVVDEAGASVYSASETAINEFPKFDLTSRSAISLARRILNPISEFVKVPPQSLGVGMYQHDVSPKLLAEKLTTETESAVSFLGANLNTASMHLLQYISGLNFNLAKKIVEYRQKNNGFKARSELLNVKGLGKKTYESAAGFCRIVNGTEPLDNTLVHPESYKKTYSLLKSIGINSINNNFSEIVKRINEINFVQDCSNSTLNNISSQLFKIIKESFEKHDFDVRQEYSKPILRSNTVNTESLKIGQKLEGVIKNITDFGVFIDIGCKCDAFLHKSLIKSNFELTLGNKLKVEIIQKDLERSRISVKI